MAWRWQLLVCVLACTVAVIGTAQEKRPHILVRGIYGGPPLELLEQDKTLRDWGVNAVFVGSSRLNAAEIARLKSDGAQVFAEFNTMHVASYLEDQPDAAPVGIDGRVAPAPHGWQGVCPTHPGYRRSRMQAFRNLLGRFEIDGVWLDYHHSHASWERADPVLPDTCFCDRCQAQFAMETGIELPEEVAGRPRVLLDDHRPEWVQWRCDVFTDWVREFRSIIDQVRPEALLGTFHCPWSESERDGALRNKLAIDLRSQAEYLVPDGKRVLLRKKTGNSHVSPFEDFACFE